MTDLTLLVMAAGTSTRYGRLKQIDPIGPTSETIIDYSIFDALRAGFSKVVFVIRQDIELPFRAAVGRRIEQEVEVQYVFQDQVDSAGTTVASREKPWGTAHAVLSAANAISEPFAVINADDYYGPDSFRILVEHFHSGVMGAALIGFALRNTLSSFGSVTRGICRFSTHRSLASVDETLHISRDGSAAKYTDSDGVVRQLTGDEIVSMNMWGFQESVFDDLHARWAAFIMHHGSSRTAEFYMPDAVTDLINGGKMSVRVLETPESWFGVTYLQDQPIAVDHIRALITRGVYPQNLWTNL